MVLPVVKDRAEIHHREARQIAALGGGADALLHRRNVVLGNGAAEDIVHELESRAARQRLHAHAADAELAVAAGLLLVLAFGVGFGAYGLAVGHLGRLQRHVHLEALAQLGHHHLDVLLARSRQQKLLGLRVARKAQRQVFLQDLVNPQADAVFVGARFRLDGKGDGRLGNAAPPGRRSARALSPRVSPVTVSFSLAMAPRSPACSSGTSIPVFPCITCRC